MTAPAMAQRSRAAPEAATGSHLAGAEWALAGVSLAVIIGFSRLFADWSFFWPLLVIAAYTHGITVVMRRKGYGVAVTALIGMAGLVLIGSWIWFGSTTTALLPTGRTWSAFTSALDESWGAFQELAAPVPALTGFVAAAGLALFFAVFLADWAAFRLWSPIEATVPALTLFVFCAVLGSGRGRIGSAVLFAAAVLLFIIAHRAARLELTAGWLTGDLARGGSWLLRTGAAISAVAIAAGVVIGPRLPGAEQPGLLGWRDGDGPSSRVVVSPLVEIKSRLVTQSDVEAFTVESEQPSYWRLTALDIFDGTIWRSGGRYSEADGQLPAELPAGDVELERIEQRFEINRLAAPWLPAAFQPVSIDAPDVGVRYQAASSTLIVDGANDSSDAASYTVVSELPRPTAEQLATATGDLAVDMEDLVALPDGFSTFAAATARSAVERAGARTPYEQALALQDFFLGRGVFATDEFDFVYDLESVDEGHSGSAIDAFLENQRGYCEQYAGTYAAMARSIGLPARVAVGFTMGEQEDPDRPNVYTVRGRNAHAWPEVWLGPDLGWISFEPTPGRGAPGMDYAGITPAQADPTDESSATTSTTAATPSSTAPPSTVPGEGPSADELEGLLGQTGAPSSARDEPSWWEDIVSSGLVRVGVPLVVLAGLLYVVVVPLLVGARRRRRREQAVAPGARVRVAWQESLEELALVGANREPHETNDEFAARVAERVPGHASDLRRLAVDTDAATFGDDLVDEAAAERSEATAAELEALIRERVPRLRLVLRRLDARPLLAERMRAPTREAKTSRR